jgi:hypothetical protein
MVLFSVVSVVVIQILSLSLRSLCLMMPASVPLPLLELGILTIVDELPLTRGGGICSGKGEPPSRKDWRVEGRAMALR